VAGLRERRVAGSISLNSKRSYSTGANRWKKEAQLKGYNWFLQGTHVEFDLICILYFIDQLAADPAVGPDAASTYWTGAKSMLKIHGCVSEALGAGKYHHTTVSQALRSVQVECSESGKRPNKKPRRLAIPGAIVSIVRVSKVDRVVYVAVVMARSLLLRSCEYVMPATGVRSQHLLSWEHLGFYLKGKKLVGEEIRTVCADTLHIEHTSRKWQWVGCTREVPDRVRMWKSALPWQGLYEDTGGCVVAVLQAWCITTQGWLHTDMPVCMSGRGTEILCVTELNRWLKEWAAEMGLDPEAIESHCLRHGGITDLLNEGVDIEDVRMAAGSKSVAALVPYVHPGKRAAMAVSEAMAKAVV
jgi:hypothetical protein